MSNQFISSFYDAILEFPEIANVGQPIDLHHGTSSRILLRKSISADSFDSFPQVPNLYSGSLSANRKWPLRNQFCHHRSLDLKLFVQRGYQVCPVLITWSIEFTAVI
jgi:hypothetical protein